MVNFACCPKPKNGIRNRKKNASSRKLAGFRTGLRRWKNGIIQEEKSIWASGYVSENEQKTGRHGSISGLFSNSSQVNKFYSNLRQVFREAPLVVFKNGRLRA